jgi:peptidylprolyl isomerase domain and WD repeat-containing protein 1
MATNVAMQCAISLDSRGMVEYWDVNSFAQPGTDRVQFKHKSESDLYDLAKSKVVPYAVAVAPTGLLFSTFSSDKQIRLFDFSKGKLLRKYDESCSAYSATKPAAAAAAAGGDTGTGGSAFNALTAGIDPLELGRRQAMERELEATPASLALSNMVFDESGNFLVFGTLKGIKVVNVVTNKVVRVLGLGESGERFLSVALYQGVPKIDSQFMLSRADGEAQASKTVDQTAKPLPDPTIFCSAFKRRRFYCFSRRDPDESTEARDKLNELPTEEERGAGAAVAEVRAKSLHAILHTTAGDIHIKLFAEECPVTVENFVTHIRNGYYNNLLFHRVIKGFMLQTGDPKGDGTGGESIWGREFDDEIVKTLR